MIREGSQPTASKGTVLHCKDLDSTNNLNEPGSGFIPRASRKESSLTDTLLSVL